MRGSRWLKCPWGVWKFWESRHFWGVNLRNFFARQFGNVFSKFKMHVSSDLGFRNLSYICQKEICGRIVIAALFIIIPTTHTHTHTLVFISRKLNYTHYTVKCHAIVKRAGWTYICWHDWFFITKLSGKGAGSGFSMTPFVFKIN